ncbi:hypothetical protein ABW20_dc0102346 [Dactylellina cionopaga]|nr:hypothetical protein ABW20_dc0102346 [Dactylellina cionopaga]
MATPTPVRIIPSLYRRALKQSLDWSVRRDIWRPQALAIRQLFEQNKDVREPKQLKALITEAESQLEKWKHPDPYIPPTAPGGAFHIVLASPSMLTISIGSKYERNLPCPILTPPPPMEL